MAASKRSKKITRRQPLCRLQDDSSGASRLHPLLRRILENRNVRTRSELDYSLNHLHPPQQLKGIEAATCILQQALRADRKIVVIGDYDVDGATATAVAVLGLRALGAKRVQYLVPNRFGFGYGLSPEIAAVALELQPEVVITVDNGISSLQGVALLRAAGVTVVITDHHLAGAELPTAEAIVNPNQPGCAFPSKALAGVGVIFYLLLAARARLRQAGWFDAARLAQPNLAELLDLVALGTVADLVPLDYNNRILVAQGVARIRAGRCRVGLKSLLEVAGRRPQNMASADFAFVIGPRLNAAGRMEDMSTGIECLLADDAQQARGYAQQLDEINRQRRKVEHSMQQQAMQIVARLEQGGEAQPAAAADRAKRFGLCLFDPHWHHGIIGLVASRVKDATNQPVIAFAPDSAQPGKLRGSARSVLGLHIRDALEAISSCDARLIEKFGGHAMAAGLTIAADQFENFSARFRAQVTAHFADHAPSDEILTDGELAADDFTVATAELMRGASPWGQHFPAPLFDGEFRVTAQKIVAKQHLKMVLEGPDGAPSLDAIAFRYVEPGQDTTSASLQPQSQRVRAAYQLQVNEFKGKRSLQLLVEYMQPAAEQTGRVAE